MTPASVAARSVVREVLIVQVMFSFLLVDRTQYYMAPLDIARITGP